MGTSECCIKMRAESLLTVFLNTVTWFHHWFVRVSVCVYVSVCDGPECTHHLDWFPPSCSPRPLISFRDLLLWIKERCPSLRCTDVWGGRMLSFALSNIPLHSSPPAIVALFLSSQLEPDRHFTPSSVSQAISLSFSRIPPFVLLFCSSNPLRPCSSSSPTSSYPSSYTSASLLLYFSSSPSTPSS